MILEPADVRVRRGYQWLQTEGPALGLDVTKLNPNTLDVEDYWGCAMAQASGPGNTYGAGIRKARGSGELEIEWAVAHGFLSLNYDDGLLLTQIWRDVIIADRNLSHAA
jgi:hypothetical protein